MYACEFSFQAVISLNKEFSPDINRKTKPGSDSLEN